MRCCLPLLLCACSGVNIIDAQLACSGSYCEFLCETSANCPCDATCRFGTCWGDAEADPFRSCVACQDHEDCGANQVCESLECVRACAPAERCQAGGSCCKPGLECVFSQCVAPCEGQRCGPDAGLCCGPGEICAGWRCVPDCGGNPRCGTGGNACCGDGEICFADACTTPGRSCAHQADCGQDEICQPDLGLCMARDVVGSCEYRPPVGTFEPQIECRWTPPPDQATPERNDVVMAPAVASLTDDDGDGRTDTFDTPDVVFVTYDLEGDGCCNVHGTLRIASGRCNADTTMVTHASLTQPPLDNSGGVALGDLDGDGIPEIVAMTNDAHPQGTVAFTRVSPDGRSWRVLWHNTQYPTWNVHTRGGTQPSLADIDGDGSPEVIVGNVVLNGFDGSLRWDGLENGGGVGNNAFLGPVSSVADVDLDGEPEVLAGNTCYGTDGSVEWTFSYTSSNSPCGGALPCDGFTATGNFDDDAHGEVVIVRLGEIFVLHHDGSLLRKVSIPTGDCPRNESGPPTVADFDGDGRPEIGTAAADYYTVIDLDCTGPGAGCAADGVLWFVPNQDCSSRVTASSVFDFDGDGRAEAVYADERSFRILDGQTGAEIFRDDTHGSHTRLEMTVIADVDNDGNAEVVIAENASGGGNPGVEIWGDRLDNWVYTRRIWNQHSYHVSNVDETGRIPAYESPAWLEGANSFRQNLQGAGLFLAPDLAIEELGVACVGFQALDVSFDVVNRGSRRAGAGVAVTVRVGGSVVAVLRTEQPLLPGDREPMSIRWPLPSEVTGRGLTIVVVADDRGDGSGEHNECDEDNRTAGVAPACESPPS